jgi:hypothetical protein
MKTTHRNLTGAALLLALAPWMAVPVLADEGEDKAVKTIKKLGGIFARDEKTKDKPIVSVDLGYTEMTDAGLKHVAGLKQLQTLDLRHTKVTDAGLEHLAGLKKLRVLNLRRTQVTDKGLEHLAGLKKLRTLSLYGTKVTDEGEADLRKALPDLEIK